MSDYNTRVIDEFHAGHVTSNPYGDHIVLVHHVGAKSGTERITPLVALPQDDRSWLIVGTKGGSPELPGWVANLRANPDTTIETYDDPSVAVRVTELTGAERDAAWAQFTAFSDGFKGYESKTDRTFPVLRLAPR